MPQLDLFAAAPTLSGLAHADAVVPAGLHDALVAGIEAAPLEPFRFQGWTGRRMTASHGWQYDFDRARMGQAEPMPPWLLHLRDHAAAFAGLSPGILVHALLTRYDPGAGIGWHRDRPVFEHVVGISFGAAATLRFRRRRAGGFDRFAVPLVAGSAYHLTGEARWDWEHGIAPVVATRWSITFRSLAERFAQTLRDA